MINKNIAPFLLVLVIAMLILQTCKTYYFRANYEETNELLHETENLQTKLFLKAHLKNGDICILKDTWQIDTLKNVVTGNGDHYDFNRNNIFEGEISISIDSVAIFETNKKLGNTETERIAALSILTGVNLILGIVCVTVPKACFGSCPTFYVNKNNDFHFADAEGFSNAISPSMEYFDIDALNNLPLSDNTFSITMKNEALETHCVNNVKLLAYPRNKGERVYQSPDNNFYLCESKYQISRATGKEGDITTELQHNDRKERFSYADKNNLKSKEEIYLNFDNIKNPNNLGLIVNFRQTLMTTYFIYSAIGYMGDNVGDIFAKMETGNKTKDQFKNGIKKELGNIDVYVWDEKEEKWEIQHGFYETGPIAFNHQILPLANVVLGSDVKLKLVMNKGLWRIDYVALTNIKEKVEPSEMVPGKILNKGIVDANALSRINSPDKYLISMPGDEYEFNFTLPMKNQDYELFLYSEGYYLEWMRDHWIQDKDLLKLRQMVQNPQKYLLGEASAYKRYEEIMEQEFWNSKIDTKLFSYHEN